MIAYAGDDVKSGEHSPLIVVMKICTTTLEISMAVSQKIGNQPTSGPSLYPVGQEPACLS